MTYFIKEEATKYYPNSLCFENKHDLKMIGNWFDNKFENFFISFDSCNNSTYNDKCKT